MSLTTRKSDIDKLPIADQLAFYKKEFEVLHCEEDHCGREVHDTWVIYDGSLYCESCYDWTINKEERERAEEIERLKERLRELQS